MKLSLKILESNDVITKSILQAMLPECKDLMNGAITKIKNQLPEIIKSGIINTPEYNSLLNGTLKYELGLADSEVKLRGLIDIWSSNIQYAYSAPSIVGNQIKSTFSANTIRVDFADVLYTDYALMIDSARGYSLPWLEWLLLEGNKTIISKQEVVFGANKFSRTGMALMRSSNKSWRIPSEFAGTARDNWITRAIDSVSNNIQEMLQKAF